MPALATAISTADSVSGTETPHGHGRQRGSEYRSIVVRSLRFVANPTAKASTLLVDSCGHERRHGEESVYGRWFER